VDFTFVWQRVVEVLDQIIGGGLAYELTAVSFDVLSHFSSL